MRHTRKPEDGLVQKALVAFDISGKHLDDIVRIPRGRVTAYDLRTCGNGPLESDYFVFAVACEIEFSQDAKCQTDLFAIDKGGVAANHAAAFQFLNALPARRRRQADQLG